MTVDTRASPVEHIGIDYWSLDFLLSQELLNSANDVPILHQQLLKATPKGVRLCVLVESDLTCGGASSETATS